MMDLPVTVAILFECTTKKFQFCWETFLVTDGSSAFRYKLAWVGFLYMLSPREGR